MPPERRHVKRQAAPCGMAWCNEVFDEARERHARRQKPQPWIARKFMVGVVGALVVYTYYVYIATFCVPMITGSDTTFGERGMGVGFLVVQCLLGFMFWWSYFMTCWRSPGMAKDVVSKCPPPAPHPVEPEPEHTDHADSAIGTPYEAMSEADHHSHIPVPPPPPPNLPEPPQPAELDREKAPRSPLGTQRSQRSLPAPPAGSGPATHPVPPAPRATARSTPSADPQVGDLAAIPAAAHLGSGPANAGPGTATPNSSAQGRGGPGRRGGQNASDESGRALLARRPPSTPVLRPEYRYCYKDGFVKPPRAHHCRTCGTCVLKYDHHCPWIGQCVGAFNHKFFVNFLFWSTLFTLWIFLTLVIPNALASKNINFNINGQQVAIMALSGLFTFFTSMLFISHARLILTNCSTVESLQAHRMKERERASLHAATSPFEIRKRREIKRQWDAEWGAIATEGNIWWLGSERRNWEAVMGRSVWLWVLPIGKSDTDGVNWPRNPRFAEDGRWRRRAEWPEEYR